MTELRSDGSSHVERSHGLSLSDVRRNIARFSGERDAVEPRVSLHHPAAATDRRPRSG